MRRIGALDGTCFEWFFRRVILHVGVVNVRAVPPRVKNFLPGLEKGRRPSGDDEALLFCLQSSVAWDGVIGHELSVVDQPFQLVQEDLKR